MITVRVNLGTKPYQNARAALLALEAYLGQCTNLYTMRAHDSTDERLTVTFAPYSLNSPTVRNGIMWAAEALGVACISVRDDTTGVHETVEARPRFA